MSFLEELLASTRVRVQEARASLTDDVLEQRISSVAPPLDFEAALRAEGVALIAEIKRATPSQGPLDLALDASRLARAYEEGGAAAVSVLTEPTYFKGSLEDLQAARSVSLPLLRKDFLFHEFQLLEARAAGADAVLLIVRVVGSDLAGLLEGARALGMGALVEVFHEGELDTALDAGATAVAINHRDLETFEVDPQRTLKLATAIPSGVVRVAASGVSTRAEVEELEAGGVDAVLVGQSLVTSPDPAAKLRELLGVR
jgi:indole-3-glycerol phosphate synthase